MNYCALEDAYQEIGGAPSPGCAMEYATKAARKEERRRAKHNKIAPPAISAISAISIDHMENVEENQSESFQRRHKHPENTAPIGSAEFDKDPLHNYVVEQQRAHLMAVPVVTEHLSSRKKFFGADPDGDAFADYIPDQDNYRLQPDFLTAFEHAGVAKAGSAIKLPNPSANMYWKPLTPRGETSFMESPSQQKYYQDATRAQGAISNTEIMNKIDKIFARLDDMNTSSPEQIHSELLMFISSGIFVLFMMDLLVKKGSTLRF